jgi:C-terminal processing protease CtpA/Prc
MRLMPKLRFALVFAVLAASMLGWNQQRTDVPAELNVAQKQEVIQAAWQAINDLFYDPHFRGVDWNAVRKPFLQRAAQAQDREALENLVRQMVALLHNSHSGVMSSHELAQTLSVLPFFFDEISNRVFVSYIFEPREQSTLPFEVGDEVLTVDGRPASEMRSPRPSWLEPVLNNAYYGPANSIATIRIRRANSELTLRVPRLQAFSEIVPMVFRRFGAAGYIRFLKMDHDSVSPQMLRSALEQLQHAQAIVLDFRHCSGGDASVADPLGAMLLGPHVKLETRVPRPGKPGARVEVEETADSGEAFRGRVVVLIDAFTSSGPEMLTAALKDYNRATIVGERSGGALNGFTEGVPLPYRVGILVVPVTRGISPKGKEYEGVGIAPDVVISNTLSDYAARRDAPLQAALTIAGKKR